MYHGQYGVHLDPPRTANQRCHKLQCSQFGSPQGLLDAMWGYQRMASTKLTDKVLESILWNKAPIELQKEIKEITVGSVQELVHKLLEAEATVQERYHRGKECNNTTLTKRMTDHRTNKFPVEKTSATQKDLGYKCNYNSCLTITKSLFSPFKAQNLEIIWTLFIHKDTESCCNIKCFLANLVEAPLLAVVRSAIILSIAKRTPKVSTTKGIKSHPASSTAF